MKSQLNNSEGKCIVTQEAGEEPRRRTFAWHAAGWIFMLALTVKCPERTEIVNIAIKLAETGEFADAYGPFLASTRAGAPAFGRACAPHC